MSTNHEEYKRKRDEILEQFEIDYADSPFNEKVFDKAAQAIDALVLEVIGDTETDKLIRPILPFQSDEAEINRYNKAQGRDWLRHEQRRIVQGDKS